MDRCEVCGRILNGPCECGGVQALKRELKFLRAVVEAWARYDAEETDIALRRYQLDDALDAYRAEFGGGE